MLRKLQKRQSVFPASPGRTGPVPRHENPDSLRKEEYFVLRVRLTRSWRRQVTAGTARLSLALASVTMVSAIAVGPALAQTSPGNPSSTTPQGTWQASTIITWPEGASINDVLSDVIRGSFVPSPGTGVQGGVSVATTTPAGGGSGASGSNVADPSASPGSGVLRVDAISTVDPLALAARDALDALRARGSSGAPGASMNVLVSSDAVETALITMRAQFGPVTADPELRYAQARAAVATLIAKRSKVAAGELDVSWARADTRRMTAVFSALAQVGTQYRYTGNRPGGFDCSGLTSYAWSVAGVKIPRTSLLQRDAMTTLRGEDLRPGDLLWRPGHIGMYLGAGEAMVHSPQTGKAVEVKCMGKVAQFGSPVTF